MSPSAITSPIHLIHELSSQLYVPGPQDRHEHTVHPGPTVLSGPPPPPSQPRHCLPQSRINTLQTPTGLAASALVQGSATLVILNPQFRPCSAYNLSRAPHDNPHSSALHRAPPRTRPPLAWSLTTQNTPTGFVFHTGQKTVTFYAAVRFFVCLYLSAGLSD